MRLLPDDYLRVRPDMCDTAIVLAGGVHADGSLPREVQGRCAVAVELYSLRVVKRLLCSGGAGDPVKEADAMKRYLIDNGVPAKHIGTETQSRDTIGNAVYSKRMLDEDLVIVVTSEYHVPRAQELFLHVYGPEYDIVFVASPSGAGDAFWRFLRESTIRAAERIVLTRVAAGDDAAAERVMRHLLSERYGKD